ncbi:MAG: hypothetical protein ACYDEB_05135 [Dehalococcoidia bacterium]
MRLAKQHIDLGLFTNNAEAMLAFWRERVGLPFRRCCPLAAACASTATR